MEEGCVPKHPPSKDNSKARGPATRSLSWRHPGGNLVAPLHANTFLQHGSFVRPPAPRSSHEHQRPLAATRLGWQQACTRRVTQEGGSEPEAAERAGDDSCDPWLQ